MEGSTFDGELHRNLHSHRRLTLNHLCASQLPLGFNFVSVWWTESK